MKYAVEARVASQIAHQERVAETLARTGGEATHPGAYAAREAIRVAVIRAIDDAASELGAARMSDGELTALFRALDPISERLFLRNAGLG